jgi:protein-tyrosine phosphatase
MLNKKEERYIESEVQKITTYLRREAGGPGLNHFSELTEHIFLSSWVGGSNREALKDYEIVRIICLSNEKKPRSLMDTYQVYNIEHKALPLSDSPDEDISKYFELVYSEIHKSVENDENILIHCQSGQSLSAAFVIYYYLKRYYMTNFGKEVRRDYDMVNPQKFYLLEIIRFVKQYRSCAEPNAEFVHQLLMAETFIKKRLKQYIDKQLEAEKKHKRERAHREAEKRRKEKEQEKEKKTEKKKVSKPQKKLEYDDSSEYSEGDYSDSLLSDSPE